jgi:hypothetical protein
MTALSQFDKALESLLSTKPPGVSGSKVQELTKLAVQNVKVSQPPILVFLHYAYDLFLG